MASRAGPPMGKVRVLDKIIIVHLVALLQSREEMTENVLPVNLDRLKLNELRSVLPDILA